MGVVKSWMVWSVLLFAGLVVGCTNPNAPLAELPTHDLDLSPPGYVRTGPALAPKTSVTGRQVFSQVQNPWAVSNARPWRYIVIHHSATENGNAEEFDAQHRRRGWDELGYHFVIDNGKGGPDGRIEVGGRWKTQKQGAHTGGTPDNEYNEVGIGICLVGNFNRRMPSSAQLASLRQLVSYLAATYDIPPGHILGHRDAPNADTQCPGAVLHGYVLGSLRWETSRRYATRD